MIRDVPLSNGLHTFFSRLNYSSHDISKIDIFHYIYAILHNPNYFQKYDINLNEEIPRIPQYENFWKWSNWGKQLYSIHINFDKVEKFPLERIDKDGRKTNNMIIQKLRLDKERKTIEVDSITKLKGIPEKALNYKLGTYTGIEWVLEMYKEKKPRYETIREKFYNYKFSDYKEQVIDLLMQVCTVSVETVKIMNEMEATGEA